MADLQADVALNRFPNLIVLGAALSDRVGTCSFNIEGWEESNSAWGKMVTGDDSSVPSGQVVEVPTCSLDDEVDRLGLTRIDVAKMDIQGGEVLAVPGMLESLRRGVIGTLLLEVHDLQLSELQTEGMVNTLFGHGYDGRCYDQSKFSRREALDALRGRAALGLAVNGLPARSYDYAERRSSGRYAKPLQFLLQKTVNAR